MTQYIVNLLAKKHQDVCQEVSASKRENGYVANQSASGSSPYGPLFQARFEVSKMRDTTSVEIRSDIIEVGPLAHDLFEKAQNLPTRDAFTVCARDATWGGGNSLIVNRCTTTLDKDLFRALVEEADTPEHYIVKMKKALDKGEFAEAARQRARYILRVHIDAACCSDPSVVAAQDAMTLHEWMDEKLQEASNHLGAKEMHKIFVQELDVLESRVDKNCLSEPQWIARYGMNAFTNASNQDLFLPAEQCQKARKDKIAELKKAYAKSKE